MGLAGFLSVFSPCVLPVLPFYLALLIVFRGHQMRSQVMTSLLFGSGFALMVFWLLTQSGIGATVVQHIEFSRFIAAVFIALIALRAGTKRTAPTVMAFLAGIAFGFGWVPCVGPSLAFLLNPPPQISDAQEIMLFLSHALGTILALIGVAVAFWPISRRLSSLQTARMTASGLLILFALLVATDRSSMISAWLLEYFDWSGVLI